MRCLLVSLLALPVLALLCGCTSLHPRLTLYTEHAVAETTGGGHRQRAVTNKAGASLTIDLP